jgi:transposase-like protein
MTTEGHSSIAQVRALLLEYRQTARRRGCYPPELRERASRCARRMRGRGRSITDIASALGVTTATASSWTHGAEANAVSEAPVSFVPLTVEGQAEPELGSNPDSERRDGQLEIAFPSGVVLRVQGADRAAVAAAITALSRREP